MLLVAVKEETQVVLWNSPGIMVFLILLVSNTLPKIQQWQRAQPCKIARTAQVHHAQLAKLAKINVGLSSIKIIM
jgi:hypothetical protein